MPLATPSELPNPWRAFLVDVDGRLPHPIEIHCLGAFVAAFYYDLPPSTNHLDFSDVVPRGALATWQELAGANSPIARKHRVHFQHVGFASLPASYRTRLSELFPEGFRHLRLFALDPHDLALSKLTSNSPADRADIALLATAVPLDAAVLRERYRQELRPTIGDPERHDRTLEMWIEACFRP
jgi:hypothetical protein